MFEISRLFEEYLKTLNAINSTLMKFFDIKTYFRLSDEEIAESIRAFYNLYLENARLTLKALNDLSSAFLKGDPDEFIRVYTSILTEFEDVYAKVMETPLLVAYLNEINKFYLRLLQGFQNFNNYVFHALGLVTRKDIVALSEAYVDLKGDIKKETRRLKKELEEIKSLLKEVVKL